MTKHLANSYVVDRDWNGQPVPADEHVFLTFFHGDDPAVIFVDAPYNGAPAPPGPAGSTDRLWEYEVVEFFLLGDDEEYLEIELGPHGHYLVLGFKGPRNVKRAHLPIEFTTKIHGQRWSGQAFVPLDLLPPNTQKCNAYAISGCGTGRRYYAHYPLGGLSPDFHRLSDFGPLK
jgi:hypothetical protein